MSKKAVYCLAHSRKEANEIVERLTKADCSSHEISVLFSDAGSDAASKKNHPVKRDSTDAGVNAGTGGLVGGALGLIAGIGVLAIPGVGPFLAAGPLLAAFGGAAIGATAGGITGALIGMGIPEAEARHYEGRITSGNVLIAVHAGSSGDLASARNIFKQTGAKDICTAGQAYADGAPAGVMEGPI